MIAPTATRAFDPYDSRPSFWQRHSDYGAAAAVFVLTAVLTVVMFPPYAAPEFAYVFATPAIIWAYRRPPLKLFVWTLAAAQAAAWITLLFWLHHVTWLGLFLLGPFVGVWVGVWYLAVWWVMPRMVGRATAVRLAAQFGLAGAWVLVEWTRTWFLGGFAWLPLAASQWQSPVILQIAAYTGAYGISFVLILMNVGFAAYAHRLFFEGRSVFGDQTGPITDGFNILRKRSQEFWTAVFLLFVCFSLFLVQVQPFARKAFFRPFGRVALVQPDIPQSVKWDPAQARPIVEVLRRLTLAAGASQPDLILWPEAVTPLAVKGDPGMQRFVESLSHEAKAPILLGSVATPDGKEWINGAFVVAPDFGLQHDFYAKRKLVAFGEYVPLRPVLGWLAKFVPIGDDFTPGKDDAPLIVNVGSGPAAFGILICYEDNYPQLARRDVLAGADALAVLTNNAWFGRGGAAYQHAAHSVLRAVETRRPVLRCGNAGWSGWIDEFGVIWSTMANSAGSVYFRGTETLNIRRDARWIGRHSFYVDHGDWFVLAALALAVFGWANLRIKSAV